MAKKHKRSMSPEELATHEMAVRLRRMSDQQLVEAFQHAASTNAPAVNAQTVATLVNNSQEQEPSPIETLLQELSEGRCKGIGGATVHKLSQFADELGLLS